MVYYLQCLRMLSLSLLLFCLGITSAHGQTKKITGVVTTGPGKEPVPGVTVRVKGGSQGTTTNPQGEFTLPRVPQNAVLVFSAIGFATQEQPLNGASSLNITLEDDKKALDEVVIVGYGQMQKRDVTGAISSVKGDKIDKRQAIDVFDALQGQVPGLQIAQESGRPGAGNSVRIRGTATLQGGADPLYIVDGAQGVNIDGINPADIESIEVLRDGASAAIYGSRSANGVVIITTKKGKAGKPQIDVRYLQSFSKLSHKIKQANADERRLYDFKRTGGNPQSLPTDSLNPSVNADNDYQDLLTRTATRRQLDFSIRGGSEAINYYGSLGYLKDQGIIINSYSDILRGRFNVEYKPGKRFTYNGNVQFSYVTENRINEGNTLNQAIQRPPTFRVYMPDGSLAPNLGGRKNPVAEALLRKNKYDIYDVNLYNKFTFNIVDGLTFTTDANARLNYEHNLFFSPKLLSNGNDQNEGGDQSDFRLNWMLQSYFNYNKTFGKDHTVYGVLGVSADQQFRRGANIEGKNYVTEEVLTVNSIQNLSLRDISTTEDNSTAVSAYGRLGYSYKGKYLFNTNFRVDGSSKFGADKRYGFFPSASLGWRFSDESFMGWAKKVLTDGKFRISYGQTGNDRIGSYDAILRYGFGDSYYNGVSGVVPNGVFGNSSLSWESTGQLNIGMDLALLDERLSISVDYYNKITDNLLYRAPLPSETGFDEVNVNFGSIQNKGLEIMVTGTPVRTKNFEWNVSANWSFNKNTVRELYSNTALTESHWSIQEGGKLGDFYGYKALGVYQYDESNAYNEDWEQLTPVFDQGGQFSGYTFNGQTYKGPVRQLYTNGNLLKGGDMIWQNTRKDSVIDDADRIILANAQPKWFASFSNNFTYKNFNLYVDFYMNWGNTIYNRARRELNTIATTNVTPDPEYIRGAWFKPGDVTIYPRAANNGMGNARELSSLYLEDGSFIRLRNVKLGYSLSTDLRRRFRLPGIMVYVYSNNLITWTNYRWFDPEISVSNALAMGLDNGRYPRKREIGFGINVNF
jgi:TonB-linked SusC/RagA family outer membrane protein